MLFKQRATCCFNMLFYGKIIYMAEPIMCPHCRCLLTDEQFKAILGRYSNAKRKTRTAGPGRGHKKESPVNPDEEERRFIPIDDL